MKKPWFETILALTFNVAAVTFPTTDTTFSWVCGLMAGVVVGQWGVWCVARSLQEESA